jgi:hypothetical protein
VPARGQRRSDVHELSREILVYEKNVQVVRRTAGW